MKKIVYTRPDGGLTVIHPVINTGEGISEEDAVRRAMKDVPADARNVAVVEAVPEDRSFRDAWTQADGKVVHDMPKAREIHRNRLRKMREPLLAELDVKYLRELERPTRPNALAEIAAKKQALRDVTADPAIEAAQTPEELKAVIPAALVL